MRVRRVARALALVLLASCARSTPPESAGGAPAQAFTRFTERSELFVEFPALVKDRESPFAEHAGAVLEPPGALSAATRAALERGASGTEGAAPAEGGGRARAAAAGRSMKLRHFAP